MSGSDAAAGAGSRRDALAALLAGSALGLAGIGAPSTAAKGNGKKRSNRKNRRQNRNDDTGNNNGTTNGSGNSGAGGGANVNLGNNVGDALPSVRIAETTTVFDGDGVFNAFSKCPEGYVPISGGFFSSVPNPQLLTSIPRLDENAWLIEINGAQQGHQITVAAICLAATVVVDSPTEERSSSRAQKARKGARRK